MELNELKNTWKQQKNISDYEYTPSELVMLINNKMISLEEQIKSRDRLEIIASILVMFFFGITFFTTESIWKQVGSVAIILSGIFIWYKLKKTQSQTFAREPSPDQPMRKYLELELKSIRKHKKLLRNVAWWYIIPIDIGLFLFTLGFDSGLTEQVIYIAIVLIASVFVWTLNQRAAKGTFDPLITDIQEAIEFMERKES
ncbi:MAG: hypothetical protein PVH63_09105 [Balneolaceae bacterium]|jgi:Flp pilus assembly protein TadB